MAHGRLEDVLLWLFYAIGQGLHVWLKAWMVVRSAKTPEMDTYREYFRTYLPVVLLRFFVATCVFMMFMVAHEWLMPGVFPQGGSPYIKIAGAGLVGVGSDALLDKFIFSREQFAWLRSAVPPDPED